jgi:hypothetical protein
MIITKNRTYTQNQNKEKRKIIKHEQNLRENHQIFFGSKDYQKEKMKINQKKSDKEILDSQKSHIYKRK